MALYAIGDLHLSIGGDKPMDVFGGRWINYVEKLREGFASLGPEDVTVLGGVLSWGMSLEAAREDFLFIVRLPGRKGILKGNHDYWWASPTRIRAVLPAGMYIVQNDSVDMGAISVCGSRGWMLPSAANFGKADEKIFNRELIRLEMSLKAARRAPVITMLHYPPVAEYGMRTAFTELISQYPVQKVVYGHLHAQSCRLGFNGTLDGIRYSLSSADFLNFAPKQIAEF